MIQRIRKGVIHAFWMVAAAAVIGAAVNLARPGGGIPFVGEWSPKTVTKIHAGDLEVIDLDEAFRLFEDGQALFIDARESGDYKNGHITGAVNIPVDKAEEHLEQIRAMLKTGKTLIAYCYDMDCPLGADLVKDFRRKGIKPVKVMPEGWVGWMDRGYPYE